MVETVDQVAAVGRLQRVHAVAKAEQPDDVATGVVLQPAEAALVGERQKVAHPVIALDIDRYTVVAVAGLVVETVAIGVERRIHAQL